MTLAFNDLQAKTIHEVFDWYEFMMELLGLQKVFVIDELLHNAVPTQHRFIGMSRKEVEDLFESNRNELDFMAMLDIMSAAEATIREDYESRLHKRGKDKVSKAFREINKKLLKQQRSDRVSLERDILDTWAFHKQAAKAAVANFKGALKLRHWLAHGRRWSPKLGRQDYSPSYVYYASNDLLKEIRR